MLKLFEPGEFAKRANTVSPIFQTRKPSSKETPGTWLNPHKIFMAQVFQHQVQGFFPRHPGSIQQVLLIYVYFQILLE
jgi:hypothetical protein